MRHTAPFALAAAMILAACSPAESQVIDAFNLPGGVELIFAVDNTDPVQITNRADTGVLGGQRGIFGEQLSPDTAPVNYRITDEQQFVVGNLSSGDASVKLLYGFVLTNGNAAQELAVKDGAYNDLPKFDLGASYTYDPGSAFAFDYQNNEDVTNVQLTILSGGVAFSSSIPLLPEAESDTTFFIPFSSFAGATAATFSNVDQIVFSFGLMPPNTILTLDNLRVTTIPEPGAWALLGVASLLGVGGWMRRRSNRRIADRAAPAVA